MNECEAYVVAASGHAADLFPSYLGVFSFADKWWNGRPLLINSNGRLMYHGNQDYGWLLSSDLDNNVIRGTMSHLSPEREKNWLYWDSSSSSYKQASLNVTCVIETENNRNREQIKLHLVGAHPSPSRLCGLRSERQMAPSTEMLGCQSLVRQVTSGGDML